jgi:3-hydroxybutyryl-CoA dehydrogenase
MDRIAVIGGRTLGAGIAEACAPAGSAVVVVVVEADPGGADRCRNRIEASLQRAVRACRLSQADAKSASNRIDAATELTAAATADLAIEASPKSGRSSSTSSGGSTPSWRRWRS